MKASVTLILHWIVENSDVNSLTFGIYGEVGHIEVRAMSKTTIKGGWTQETLQLFNNPLSTVRKMGSHIYFTTNRGYQLNYSHKDWN